jgi:hypothetical protein
LKNEYCEKPSKPNQKNSRMFIDEVLQQFNIEWKLKTGGVIERNINKLLSEPVKVGLRIWDLNNVEHILERHENLRRLYEHYNFSRCDNSLSEDEKELKILMKSIEKVMYLRYISPPDRSINFNPAVYRIDNLLFPNVKNSSLQEI